MASVASSTAKADAQSLSQHLNMPTCNARSQLKKRSKRKHESLSSSLCATLVEHQLGMPPQNTPCPDTSRVMLTYSRPVDQRPHAPRFDPRLFPEPPILDDSILHSVLLRCSNRSLQPRLAGLEVCLALHHRLHRSSRSRHGLRPGPNGQKMRYSQEESHHSLCRASLVGSVLRYFLVPRNCAYLHKPTILCATIANTKNSISYTNPNTSTTCPQCGQLSRHAP